MWLTGAATGILFRSVSTFSPICAPMQCPWGQKSAHHYLGEDQQNWRQYDTAALIEDGRRVPDLLIDQGLDDQFLAQQLYPDVPGKPGKSVPRSRSEVDAVFS